MQFRKGNETATWHGAVISDPDSEHLTTLYKEYFSSSLASLNCDELATGSATLGAYYSTFQEKKRHELLTQM